MKNQSLAQTVSPILELAIASQKQEEGSSMCWSEVRWAGPG